MNTTTTTKETETGAKFNGDVENRYGTYIVGKSVVGGSIATALCIASV